MSIENDCDEMVDKIWKALDEWRKDTNTSSGYDILRWVKMGYLAPSFPMVWQAMADKINDN